MAGAIKRPTILDVAREAVVSGATVSHVLNGTRHVLPETEERVWAAAAKVGYRRNAVARTLVGRRSRLIGCLVADVSDAFHRETLAGVETALAAHDYFAVICNAGDDLGRHQRYVDMLLARRLDGLLVAASENVLGRLTAYEREHLPLVLLGRWFGEEGFPFVGIDNEGAGHDAARHLIAEGHTRIGLLGSERWPTRRDRVAGVRRALREAHLEARAEWLIVDPSNGREAMAELLRRADRPSALVLAGWGDTLSTLHVLRDLELRCPDDVALVTFEDDPWAAVSDPPLTTVRQPAFELGRRAAELLLAAIQGTPVAETRVILDCELIIRASSRRIAV